VTQMGTAVTQSKLAPGENPLRILLVDDEPNIRQALSEFLTTINRHKVVSAGSGEEALAKFRPANLIARFWISKCRVWTA
jgi:DNA-binding NtrC family response regulator